MRWGCPPRACSTHRKPPPRVPRLAAAGTRDGSLYAGLNAERLISAGQGQQPQRMRLRRGQDHIAAAAAPGKRLHPQQGAQ
jgi:hypothetical protein